MSPATSKDVARVAGVSQSTVSYVMTGKRSITEATRARVLAAMAELNFEPHAGARALAGNRTNVVALMAGLEGLTDAVTLVPFIASIAAAARAKDYEVLLVTSDQGPEGLRRVTGRAMCDGVVMMEIKTHDERVPVAAALPVPVVLIGIPADPHGLHCVDVDFGLAARMAVDELAAGGHQRVIFVGHSTAIVEKDVNYVSRFLDAGRGRAAHHEIPCEVITLQRESGYVAATEAVDAAERVRAEHPGERLGFVLSSSSLVKAVVDTMDARGLIPGRDLSIIGLCSDSDAAACSPAVTNLSPDFEDVSRRAMEILFQLLEAPSPDDSELVELIRPRLTRRASVMPATG